MEHKEAIEIVKKNYPHVGFSGSQFETALRVLVPELAESEDEKIRKELFFFLQEINETKGVPARFFVWLEKQKEQKEQKRSWTEIDKSREGVVFPFNARVKDSDKVVTIIDGQLNSVGKLWIRFASNKDDGFKVYNPEDLLVEQKPAEWSKEDERILYNVIAYVGYAAGQRGVRDDEFKEANSWLKSLRPQLKREAWTEEDSLAIKEIQNALEIYMINHGISEKQRKKLARWLDIHCNAYPLPAKLYPHWKPSEEQMKCLEDCVNRAREMHNASTSGYDAYHTLSSLYNDLEKL